MQPRRALLAVQYVRVDDSDLGLLAQQMPNTLELVADVGGGVDSVSQTPQAACRVSSRRSEPVPKLPAPPSR
jgi:hypothetical protein